jgi:chaperone modulatory protein CbpM
MRSNLSILQCQVVEEEVEMTLGELCQASDTDHALIQQLVAHGVLEPRGNAPQGWVFVGPSLQRTRAAVRLMRDLELNLPGAALALDLLEQIARLQRDLAATASAQRSG